MTVIRDKDKGKVVNYSKPGYPATQGHFKNRAIPERLLGRKYFLAFSIAMILVFQTHIAFAAPVFVQKKDSSSQNISSVVATFDSTPISGNLLIAIVSNRANSSPTTPTGWSVAISTTAVSPGQVIYYKTAGASEPTTVTVTGYATTNQRLGIQLFEYSGVDTLDQTNQSSGNGSVLGAPSITTSVADELVIVGVVTTASATLSLWSGSFTEQHDFGVGGFGTQITAGAADRIATSIGTYGSFASATSSGNWRGQIASFSESLIDISGTCKQLNQSTDCTDTGTVRVAINATLQAETQLTVAGTWTISGITPPPSSGDVITVFIDGATDNREAVAVTRYDGTGNITGVELIEEHLTIGSDDNQTLSNGDLGQYDNSVSGDEDIFHEVNGANDLTVDFTAQFSAEELYIKTGNTYRPDSGSSGNVSTHDIEINGILTADGNIFTVSGNWTNNDTFTADTSTVIFDGTNQLILGSTTFNNLSKTESTNNSTDVTLTFDNTATQTINGTLTLDGFDADDRINLVSDSPGTQWSLVLGASAVKVIDFVDVSDSDASGSDSGLIPILPTNGTDSGNTIAWFDRGKLIKRAFFSSTGTAIADTSTLPKGTRVKFLIYSNNPGAVVNDVSVRDMLAATFLYQGVVETGTSSLKVHNATAACVLVICTAGEEATIFSDVDATSIETETVDGDEVSISGVTIDAGNQNVGNAVVNIGANTVWALSFEVKMQ